MGFWIPAGSRDEPATLVGTTHFIEHLLFKGSSKYSAEEIAQIFDALGGELNASTSREYVVVYGRFLDDQLPVALDVMTDMLIAPTFNDLDREREVVLEEIAMVEDSPQDLIHDVLAEVVLDGHPLAHPILGTRESIAGASEEDIRAYHGRRFRFDDMVVAAAGNIDHDKLREMLMAQARWGHQRRATRGRLRSSRRTATRRFVSKETEQMHVCLGGVGLARDDERRFQLSVLDSLFGGSLSSRLFQEVREKRGLVYSVYSFSSLYEETGLSGIYFGCRPERLEAVMETVGRELVRLVERAGARRRAAAGQGASQGSYDTGAGKHVQPHDPSGQGCHHRHRDTVIGRVGAARGRGHQRAAHGVGEAGVPAGIPVGGGHRGRRGQVRCGRAGRIAWRP